MMRKISSSIAATFISLRHRNFRYFWLGQCVSMTGTWMQRTAQVWLVYTITKSPLMVGILGVCQFMPMLLFSLFAGAVVDRFPKKRILLITQVMFLLQAVAMTVLTFTGVIQYWHVFILIAFFGITQTFDMPARQSYFIELVGRDDVMNAISLNSTAINLTKIVGPAISGIIMVTYGPGFCFLFNAISYVAVIIGLALIDTPPICNRTSGGKMLSEISEGLKYIRSNDILVLNVIIMAVVCTFTLNGDVVMPVFAKEALGQGAAGYSILMSATGIGSFCGALFMAFMSKYGVRKELLIYNAVVVSAIQIATLFVKSFPLCVLLLAINGFLNLSFINTANAVFQLRSSDEYRGRVMGVYAFLNQGSTPVGNFFAGSVMQQFGGAFGYFACGVATLVFLLPVLAAKRKTIKEWN